MLSANFFVSVFFADHKNVEPLMTDDIITQL